jgi:hypothetical protein
VAHSGFFECISNDARAAGWRWGSLESKQTLTSLLWGLQFRLVDEPMAVIALMDYQ